MSTDPVMMARARVVPGWLKSALLAAFVFVACWATVIGYWRATASNPATEDLLLYLFGVPLCLLLLYLVGRKLLHMHAAVSVAVVTPVPEKSTAALSQTPSLAVLAVSVRVPHGTSPNDLATAITENRGHADLDKELVDDNGFPVMTVRSNEARDEVLQEQITEWLAINDMAELGFNDEQWRTLTLASAVAGELATRASVQLPHDKTPILQLIPLLPAEWGAVYRHATSLWLKHIVAQYGWPADRIVVSKESTDPNNGNLPIIFNGLAKTAGTDATFIAMVVACASHIGDETIAEWAANASLFTSSRPQGKIPGEGAAGLLITSQQQAGSIEGAMFALLDTVEEARRDTSADDSKRTDPKLLEELTTRSLRHSASVASDVAMIIADTGQRSSRVLELLGYVSVAMPQLEQTDDVVRVGIASGTCGTVPFITALALGYHYALAREAPVLCISNEDPYNRIAAVIRPANS